MSRGPKEGNCKICGKEIKLYDSHWHDAATGAIYCIEPDKENPAPIGPCFLAARNDILLRNWKEFAKFLHGQGLTYYTDG